MKFMLVFLVLCVVLGLWSPPQAKRGWIVAVLAAALVIFFWATPQHM